MKSGYQDVFVGCLFNTILFPFVLTFSILLNSKAVLGVFVIILPLSFAIGRKLIARMVGPETALWLMTNSVGVSFAYLSIELFRQDKKFSKVEMEGLCRYFAKEFGNDLYDVTRSFAVKYKAKKIDVKRHTKKVAALEHRYRAMFLHQLFAMALMDGKYKKEEDVYLQHIAKLIRVSNKNFLIIKSNFVNPVNSGFKNESGGDKKERNERTSTTNGNRSFSEKFFSNDYSAYLSLGLNRFATNDEIKKAFRNAVMKYHPDKFNGKSEAHKRIAKQRFREVKEAYELIKKERGIK